MNSGFFSPLLPLSNPQTYSKKEKSGLFFSHIPHSIHFFTEYSPYMDSIFKQQLKKLNGAPVSAGRSTLLDFPIFRAWPHARLQAKSWIDFSCPFPVIIFRVLRISESVSWKIFQCGKPIFSDFSISYFRDYSEVFFRPRRFAHLRVVGSDMPILLSIAAIGTPSCLSRLIIKNCSLEIICVLPPSISFDSKEGLAQTYTPPPLRGLCHIFCCLGKNMIGSYNCIDRVLVLCKNTIASNICIRRPYYGLYQKRYRG